MIRRRTELHRHTPLPRSGRPKSKPRSAKQRARIYGPKGRAKFVRSLACAACHVDGWSVNAHLLGNDGLSRKQGFATIGPLCQSRYDVVGCHELYDRFRSLFTARYPTFDALRVADDTERQLQASLGGAHA